MRVLAVAAILLLASVPGCLDGVLGGGNEPGPKDFVSSAKYTKWVIEIDTIQGMAPPQSAMDLLMQRLQSVADKPAGIEFRHDDSLPARGGTWSLRDLTQYSDAHLEADTEGNTAVIHLLFLDGSYDGGEGTALGVTVSSTRNGKVVASGPIAIFSESIRGACGLQTLCTDNTPIWGPVLVHEFGHAMGLVNNGAPMQTPHEDTGHPGHSSNENSVMYYQVESANILNFFGSRIPSDFDANDRADLCALGGKC